MAEQKIFRDRLANFRLGVNSDIDPLLLPPDQLAWMVNGTNRGTFISPRPAWVKIPLTFFTPELQSLFEDFLFQGSDYFKSNIGVEQIVVQIGGRLFRMTLSGSGMLVEDITVPGDPNSATAPIAWMNQALQWELISDGTSANRIAYDGTVSRRLNPNADNLGTTSADFNIPAIGDNVSITLVDPFLGVAGQTVIIDGFNYAVESTGGSNQILINNVNDTSGATYPIGTPIYVVPNIISHTTLDYGIPSGTYPAGTLGFIFFAGQTSPNLSSVTSIGDHVSVGGMNFVTTNNVNGTGQYGIISTQTYGFLVGSSIPSGSSIALTPSSDPITPVGYLSAPFSPIGVGASGVADLVAPYTGADNQGVQIGGFSYTITAVPSASPGTTLVIQNLNAPFDLTTPIKVLTGAFLFSVPELPPGRMGAYGMGHEAVCLTDGVSFIYGDTDGAPSGSASYNYQDAVLKTTENTFLSGGGTFRIPTSGQFITSMNFPAVLDAALGQGPLQIGTPFGMFSCLVPTDRSTWVALTNPILPMSLIGTGPLAQDSTMSTNSDTLFRSYVGVGSLILAVRQFNQPTGNWGNTPISAEVIRALRDDNQSLLQYGCGKNFDNRTLETCSPQLNAGHGIYHRGLVSMNLDPLSSLQGKVPSCWEGMWTGLRLLKMVSGTFASVNRTFAFSLNATSNKVEMWELTTTGSPIYSDNGSSPIEWSFETPVIFNPENRDPTQWLLTLNNGQLFIRKIFGTVRIRVMYRPDFWPCWVDWFTTTICQTGDKPGYLTPVGLGTPKNNNPPSASFQRPFRRGRFFQLRVEITGYCEFMGAEFEAFWEPTVPFATPESGEVCCQTIDCQLPDDFAYVIPE